MQINPSCGESLKQNHPSEKASILQVQPCLASLSHLVICQKKEKEKKTFWREAHGSVNPVTDFGTRQLGQWVICAEL